MRAKSTLKYIISALLLFASLTASAQLGDDDSGDSSTRPKEDIKGLHQFCFGVDIAQPVSAAFYKNRKCYEVSFDYYLGKEFYGVLEGGFGYASVDYPDLSYSSNNKFFRLGLNKSILVRLTSSDWDMGFIGFRYGFATINRSAATYTIFDNFYGNSTGTIPAKDIFGHWLEIAGGMRVELFAGINAGWTIRGKFLLNAKAFSELAPSYVAGYGKGDKGSVFDYNFYISYALRWGKKKETMPKKDIAPAPTPLTK